MLLPLEASHGRLNENRRTRCTHAQFLVLTLLLFSACAFAGEINACKYLVVTDFANDPYGIAQELRDQASTKGFAVVTAIADLSPNDLLQTV